MQLKIINPHPADLAHLLFLFWAGTYGDGCASGTLEGLLAVNLAFLLIFHIFLSCI